jgi:hypothetical protein
MLDDNLAVAGGAKDCSYGSVMPVRFCLDHPVSRPRSAR